MLVMILIMSMMACVSDEVAVTDAGTADGQEMSAEISESDEAAANDETSAQDEISSDEISEESSISETAENEEDSDVTSEEASSEEASVEEVSEEESEEPAFTVEAYDAILVVKKAVNVRKGPSTDYEKIGVGHRHSNALFAQMAKLRIFLLRGLRRTAMLFDHAVMQKHCIAFGDQPLQTGTPSSRKDIIHYT